MAALQKPPYVYMNGGIVAWDDARIHVSAEALIRGMSVFEGIKGYWKFDNSELALLALRKHFDRLTRSTRLQHLPFSMSYDAFRDACAALVGKLKTPDKDLWLRTTVYAVEGNWGADTVTDLVITCYQQEKARPAPIDLGVSTWQRPLDTGLPARIKSPANYQAGRLARIEGRRQGFGDMVLLNQWGRVAEATGACVLVVRDGCVATPPPHEGCLESITVDILEGLCRSLNIPFERRPIDRSELLVADEIALAGTLMELGVVRRMESQSLPAATPVFDKLRDEYWACMRGERKHAVVTLTRVA